MKILVTGGAGFIGSNFMHYEVSKYPNDEFVCLDALTYAGNYNNIKDLEDKDNYKYNFIGYSLSLVLIQSFLFLPRSQSFQFLNSIISFNYWFLIIIIFAIFCLNNKFCRIVFNHVLLYYISIMIYKFFIF